MEADPALLYAPNTLPPALQSLVVTVAITLVLAATLAGFCVRSSISELLLASRPTLTGRGGGGAGLLVLPRQGGVARVVDSYKRRHAKTALQGGLARQSRVISQLLLPVKAYHREPQHLTVAATAVVGEGEGHVGSSPHGGSGAGAAPHPPPISAAAVAAPVHIVVSEIGAQALHFELRLWCDVVVQPVWGLHASALAALHTTGLQGLHAFHSAGGVPAFLHTCHVAMVEWHVTRGEGGSGSDTSVDVVSRGGAGAAEGTRHGSTNVTLPLPSPALSREGGVPPALPSPPPFGHPHNDPFLFDPTDAWYISHSQMQYLACGTGGRSSARMDGTGGGVAMAPSVDCGVVESAVVPGIVFDTRDARAKGATRQQLSLWLREQGVQAGGEGRDVWDAAGGQRPAARVVPPHTSVKLCVPIPDMPPLTMTEDGAALCALVITPPSTAGGWVTGATGAADGEEEAGGGSERVHAIVVVVQLGGPRVSASRRAGGGGGASAEAVHAATVPPSPQPCSTPEEAFRPETGAYRVSFGVEGQTLAVLPGRSVSVGDVFIEGGGSGAAAQCVVCLSAPPSVLMLTCRHLAVCAECHAHLDKCPVCRAPPGDGGHILVPSHVT